MRNDFNEFLALEYSKTYDKRNEKSKLSFSYVTIIISLFAAYLLIFSNFNNVQNAFDESGYFLLLSGLSIFTNSIILLAMENTVRTYQVAGYLRFLEELINDKNSATFVLWESH